MVRYVNSAIESKVQVLDSSDDPAESATVSYIVYDEGDSVFATGSMTHVDNGIYSVSWTPDAAGEWTFECYSSSPKFRKAYVYHVQATTAITKYAYKFYLKTLDQAPPVQNTLYEVFNETGGVKLLALFVQQDNTGVAAEEIDTLITIDSTQILYDSSGAGQLNSGTSYCMFIGTSIGATVTDLSSMFDASATLGEIIRLDGTQPYGNEVLAGHDIKVEVRQTSGVDAGARIRAIALIEVLEEVT